MSLSLQGSCFWGFFSTLQNCLLLLRILPFYCFSFQHVPFLLHIFFDFLLEYDIALKRINVILGYIRQGYFQKGKYFSSILI